MRRDWLPFLATYALAWHVVTVPTTYAALILGAKECTFRPAHGVAAAGAAASVLLLGGRAVLRSERWPGKLIAWTSLLAPPPLGLLIGFGCNVLWW